MVIKKIKKRTGVKKRIDASVSSTKKAAKTIAIDRKIEDVVKSPTFTKRPYNLHNIDELEEVGRDYDIYGTPRSDFVPSDIVIESVIKRNKLSRRYRKNLGKRRYIMGGTTAEQDEEEKSEEQPLEEQTPRGIRGDAPRGVISKIKTALDYKRAHKNFAHKHNLMRDSDVPYRFWLDRENFIEVDVFDPLSVEQAERQIYAFKRNPSVVRASPELLAQKNARPKNALGNIISHTNPEALKDLYGGVRRDIPYYDPRLGYDPRFGGMRGVGVGRGVPRSFIDILEGEYPETTDIIRDNYYIDRYGKKKKIPSSKMAQWFTGRRVTKQKQKPKQNKKR